MNFLTIIAFVAVSIQASPLPTDTPTTATTTTAPVVVSSASSSATLSFPTVPPTASGAKNQFYPAKVIETRVIG